MDQAEKPSAVLGGPPLGDPRRQELAPVSTATEWSQPRPGQVPSLGQPKSPTCNEALTPRQPERSTPVDEQASVGLDARVSAIPLPVRSPLPEARPEEARRPLHPRSLRSPPSWVH